MPTSTVNFYARQLRLITPWATENHVTLQKFKARHMRQYLASRREKSLSDRTCRSYAVAMKTFLKFCPREEYIASNPLADYQVPKAAKPYVRMPSDEEISLILRTIEEKRRPGINVICTVTRSIFVALTRRRHHYRVFWSTRAHRASGGDG